MSATDKIGIAELKLPIVGSGSETVTKIVRDDMQEIVEMTARRSGETFEVTIPADVIAAMRDTLVAQTRKSLGVDYAHPAVQPTRQSLDDAIRDKVSRANELLKAMGGITLHFEFEEDELLPPGSHVRPRVDVVAVNEFAREEYAQFNLNLSKAMTRLIQEGTRMGYEVALETHFGEKLKLAAATATAAAVLEELTAAEQRVERQRAEVRKTMGASVEKVNAVRQRSGLAPLKHVY